MSFMDLIEVPAKLLTSSWGSSTAEKKIILNPDSVYFFYKDTHWLKKPFIDLT